MRKFLASAAAIAMLALATATPTAAAPGGEPAPSKEPRWPQWRGEDGQGIAADAHLPTEWSPTQNIAWSTPIPGKGHSSPIVWGDRVFLTTSIEGEEIPGAAAVVHTLEGQPFVHPDATAGNRKHTLQVLCLDRRTGRVLWTRTAYEGRVFDDRYRKSTYANTTPATDGRHVYAWFGSEGLYVYDFNGRLVWKKSLGGIPTLGAGTASSPILFERLVILQCDEDNGDRSFIVALEAKTGKEVWRTPRTIEVSWATPVIARAPATGNTSDSANPSASASTTTKARDELITSGNQFIIAYDPRTGRELWRCKGTGSYTVATPIVGHGIVIASASSPVKRAVAIRLGGAGDVTDTPQIVWQRDRGTGYTPSSIVYGDYAYLLTDRGLLTCIDIKTGEVKYEGARVPKPATFSASPIAYAGHLLLSSEDGDAFLIKAGPTHEVVRTNSLNEPIYASPAAAADTLFIRTTTKLYAITDSAGRR